MAVTMIARWDDAGTVIPGGDAEYVVAEQPIAEYDNWFNYNIVADIQAVIDDVINRFNANTILKADTDNTPAALVVAEQTIVGRKTGNSIAALTDAEVLVIIGVEAGATADQTNTEIRDAVEAAADSNTFTDADHTKLNGVEDLATTDQTNNEIRDAVEAATDSNTFKDADHTKLNGMDSGADVTADNAPQAHASTHVYGQSDAITVKEYTITDDVLYSNDAAKSDSTGTSTYVKVKEMLLVKAPNKIRTYFTGDSGTIHAVQARVYRDGVGVGTEQNVPATSTNYTEDISGWSDGDLYQIWVKTEAGESIEITNQRILGAFQSGEISTPTNQDP